MLKTAFINYLIDRGYTEFSLNGSPSTVYDYVGRIERVCLNDEKITMRELALSIDTVLPKYEYCGSKRQIGKRSHESVLNALRQFKKFVHSYPPSESLA